MYYNRSDYFCIPFIQISCMGYRLFPITSLDFSMSRQCYIPQVLFPYYEQLLSIFIQISALLKCSICSIFSIHQQKYIAVSSSRFFICENIVLNLLQIRELNEVQHFFVFSNNFFLPLTEILIFYMSSSFITFFHYSFSLMRHPFVQLRKKCITHPVRLNSLYPESVKFINTSFTIFPEISTESL